MDAKSVILQEYHGSRNLMTQRVESYDWIIPDLFAVEISTGTGFRHDLLVGVSIVSIENGETTRERELSGAFSGPGAMENAHDYVERLKEELA